MPEENLIKLHKGGYTGDKTQMIFLGGTFRDILMLSGKMLYVDDQNSGILLVNGLK